MVANLIIECLKAHHVNTIFGYPGGAIMPTYDAIYDSGLDHLLCRNEQGAAMAAIGYARASGKVGVCIATSGPGATNEITGIATAYSDSIPLVVISGQVGSPMIGSDAFQEIDMVGIPFLSLPLQAKSPPRLSAPTPFRKRMYSVYPLPAPNTASLYKILKNYLKLSPKPLKSPKVADRARYWWMYRKTSNLHRPRQNLSLIHRKK